MVFSVSVPTVFLSLFPACRVLCCPFLFRIPCSFWFFSCLCFSIVLLPPEAFTLVFSSVVFFGLALFSILFCSFPPGSGLFSFAFISFSSLGFAHFLCLVALFFFSDMGQCWLCFLLNSLAFPFPGLGFGLGLPTFHEGRSLGCCFVLFTVSFSRFLFSSFVVV
jgi:hypothetical protein